MQPYYKQVRSRDWHEELSSVPLDWSIDSNIHISKNEFEMINGFVHKIPRPYNFDSSAILLDNVHWDEEQPLDKKPCYKCYNGEPVRPDAYFRGYSNNCVTIIKDQLLGYKNSVRFCVERYLNDNELAERPLKINELIEKLGKPSGVGLYCMFEPSEYARFEAAKKEIYDSISKDDFRDLFEPFNVPDTKSCDELPHLVEKMCTPIKGISPKKVFSSEAKKIGYEYSGFGSGGDYYFEKKLSANHVIQVNFHIMPFESVATVYISIFGCNFDIMFLATEQLYVENEGVLSQIAELSFECAQRIEEKYSKLLLEKFGETPAWWRK